MLGFEIVPSKPEAGTLISEHYLTMHYMHIVNIFFHHFHLTDLRKLSLLKWHPVLFCIL